MYRYPLPSITENVFNQRHGILPCVSRRQRHCIAGATRMPERVSVKAINGCRTASNVKQRKRKLQDGGGWCTPELATIHGSIDYSPVKSERQQVALVWHRVCSETHTSLTSVVSLWMQVIAAIIIRAKRVSNWHTPQKKSARLPACTCQIVLVLVFTYVSTTYVRTSARYRRCIYVLRMCQGGVRIMCRICS